MTRPKKFAKRSVISSSGLAVPMTRSLTIPSTISRPGERTVGLADTGTSRAATHMHHHPAASSCDTNQLMRSIESGRLGLPRMIRACLFDLDGVLTRTAHVHAAAWEEMFDAFLRDRATQTEEPFVP